MFPKEELQQTVKDCLPGIIKDAVKQALESRKLVSSYAEAVKKAQEGVVEKAKSTFDTTLESALVRNQQKIIDSTKAKSDAEEYERKHRRRNIVITNIDESASTENQKRISDDIEALVNQCNIQRQDIVSCFRAGRPRVSEDDDSSRVPRPIIATLITPELACDMHEYGMGRKVTDKIWINQDLTRSERVAAYNARNARRSRRMSNNQSNTKPLITNTSSNQD